jgi:hypothetical protein
MNAEEVYASIPTAAQNKYLLQTLGETFLCALFFLFG